MTFAPKRTALGQTIRDRVLTERGMTQGELAQALGMVRPALNSVIMGKRRLTAKLAVRLSLMSELSAEEWLQMQSEIDLAAAREMLIADSASGNGGKSDK